LRAAMKNEANSVRSTQSEKYAERLLHLESAGWKRFIDVQAPYRWNIRRLAPGFVLDVGCGLGRNLLHLGGNGIGINHNPDSVAIARSRGLKAFLPEEFAASSYCKSGSFDTLLCAHVVEHMSFAAAQRLVSDYLPLVRPDGQVILITPQEAGFRSDPTHVELFDFARLAELLQAVGLTTVRSYSFPFPRAFGQVFKYNEFVVIGRKPEA
jgi:2-polyprenyl-3-methyl-5-hydroxy-6-metoxy-1,4-benzoquinol methylase